MNIEWSRRAARDLFSVYEYIATENENAATRIVDRIRAAVNGLALQPHMGRPSPFRNRRELMVDRYVVTYSVRGDGIFIISLEHGAQRK